eukprot:781695-Prorocentrum_lima.AAC.1
MNGVTTVAERTLEHCGKGANRDVWIWEAVPDNRDFPRVTKLHPENSGVTSNQTRRCAKEDWTH